MDRDLMDLSRGQFDAGTPAAGLSALERAAKRGIGPMSADGAKVWHGDCRPCVSCGELLPRQADTCEHCGQEHSPDMLDKMRMHSGPWYVLEHVRPFPGVSLERLVRQIRRGVLVPTTIVRGPTTFHQWRFAAETPGLSKHMGLCWHCQSPVTAMAVCCSECGAAQDRLDIPAQQRDAEELHARAELANLSEVVKSMPDREDAGRRGAGRALTTQWIVGILLVCAIVVLFLVVKLRGTQDAPAEESVPAGVSASASNANES